MISGAATHDHDIHLISSASTPNVTATHIFNSDAAPDLTHLDPAQAYQSSSDHPLYHKPQRNHHPEVASDKADRPILHFAQPPPATTGILSASRPADHVPPPAPTDYSTARSNGGKFVENWDASQRGSLLLSDSHDMERSNSVMSQGGMSQNETLIPSRGGTLKKKATIKRGGSVKRSSSRRSSRAGSVRSLALQPSGEEDEMRSAFFSPVPTSGNPTEILAVRFNAWRKVLKDLITYFREIQTQYDQRSKSLLKVSNVINNTSMSALFLETGGIGDALSVLRDYHRQSILEANKSKDIENDVILALTGLRSDLQQKIKEIKSLSGDFKNSVDKEMDATRRAVNSLHEGLGHSDIDPSQMTGKQDPYLLRLAVDRQVERQIDEENYLHQAYLNLEASGSELEAIVVGEIQKSYNAYAGILKREADGAYGAVEELRTGPVSMPKDLEWRAFVEKDEHFVDPRMPVRQAQNIHYPGRDSELAAEIRAGLLERKSKYLKSYTAGWYVLSATHLHEFKSADKSQAPIMSLYLPDQKVGSHSAEGGSSNKFMLKGRQTGSMHRGHSWVFRAESHETMMAWYEDIKTLTEQSPQERNAFVRQHARSVSGTSQRAGSVSSDGVMDEEDEEPFSAAASSVVVAPAAKQDALLSKRPQPGGRFPSDLQVNTQRGLQAPISPTSGSSGLGDVQDRDFVAAADASALPGSGIGQHYAEPSSSTSPLPPASHQNNNAGYGINSPPGVGAGEMEPTRASELNHYAQEDGVNPYTNKPIQQQSHAVQAPAELASNIDEAAVAGPSAGRTFLDYREGDDDVIDNDDDLPDGIRSNYEGKGPEAGATRETTDLPSSGTVMDEHPRALAANITPNNTNTDAVATSTVKPEKFPINSESRPPVRPSVLQSMSHLHIPGEFPKSTPTSESAQSELPA